MNDLGLRERKKLRTREAILEAAFRLFQESAFAEVSVADVAAAAEVSKPTLFAYFPTKDDLVLGRFLGNENGPAQVIRGRPLKTHAIVALRTDWVERLSARDPLTGLSESPEAITFHNLLYTTPSIMARLTEYMLAQEQLLAVELAATAEFPDSLTAHLLASEVFGAQRVLSERNADQVRAGHHPDTVYPTAVNQAHDAYDLIEHGIRPLRRKSG